MPQPLYPSGEWALLEPLLPPPSRSGRPRLAYTSPAQCPTRMYCALAASGALSQRLPALANRLRPVAIVAGSWLLAALEYCTQRAHPAGCWSQCSTHWRDSR